MKDTAGRIAKKLARRKRRVEKRLQVARDTRHARAMSGAPPVFSTAGLKSELADKSQAISVSHVGYLLRTSMVRPHREKMWLNTTERDEERGISHGE